MGPCKPEKRLKGLVNARDFEQCKHTEIKDLALC